LERFFPRKKLSGVPNFLFLVGKKAKFAGYLLAYQNHTETTLRIKSSPSTTHKKYSAILGGSEIKSKGLKPPPIC